MKFRITVVLSIIFHFSLFAIAFFYPDKSPRKSTTYYVDLIHLNGGGPEGGNNIKSEIKNNIKAEVIEEDKGKVKNLTVKKEPESKLRFPDKKVKKNKKKEKKKELITVVRKKRKINSDKSKKRAGSDKVSDFIKTGLSGSGSGTGSGQGGIGGNFPYAYYVETLKNKISSSWYNPLSSTGMKGKFTSVVYFRIYRNGEIGNLKLVDKSGNVSYDLSTMRVIREVTPFPPLPSDYPELYLGVYFEFEWEK
ncbi:MAG: TonB C-terminal domain-containing protein [Acidobacteriota bacterium]